MQDGSEARLKNNTGNETNWKKQLAWSLVFVVIAAASVWAVASQSRGFSLAAFGEFIRGASLPWLAAAILCMLIYIYAEGVALNCICASFSCRMRRRDGFVYASADIYFSAITPSATGGQPASAYFMIQDGIPGPTATVALLVALLARPERRVRRAPRAEREALAHGAVERRGLAGARAVDRDPAFARR